MKFLGVLPEDVKEYDLLCYDVNERDVAEARSLKKAKDALENDPFFHDKKNKRLADVLHWLVREKKRCEQQAVFSVDPKDPRILEKVIVEKKQIEKRFLYLSLHPITAAEFAVYRLAVNFSSELALHSYQAISMTGYFAHHRRSLSFPVPGLPANG